MISTVSLSFDLTYTNPATGALQPRGVVVDSTDYTGLGIDLLNTGAKGYGVVTFNGDIIVNLDTVLTPMIDLQNWNYANGVPTYAFDLPLDLNGNVANGVYQFTYSLRLTSSFVITSITLPETILSAAGLEFVNFFEAGNDLTMLISDTTVQVVSSELSSPTQLELTVTGLANDTDTQIEFDITNVQLSNVYTYAGCTQTTADVSFIYDCEYENNGTWAVANTTPLASNEIVASLNCVVSYPSWTAVNPSFNPQVVLTSLPYPTSPDTTPLATGTYTVSLTQQIQQTQSSGLVVIYPTSVIKEFVVSCAGSLCGLTPCIENLRAAHQAELVRNRVSKYQVFVDNVLMYYTEAINYKACGEIDNYRASIARIQDQLDASGCECACCDDETYYWVSNNSANSVIQTLLDNFQYRLYDGAGADPGNNQNGVQLGAIWQDISTGVLYRCTNATPGGLLWEEYYAPGMTPDAIDIPADNTGHGFLNANNVQLQLDQADALAVFDGANGLNKVGNDVRLGGTLDDDTTINVNGNDFIIQSDDSTLEVIATAGVPLLLDVNQNFSGVGLNLLLQTTNTAGVGANGMGSSIQFAAENGAGATSTTSTIRSTWVNATTSNSNFQITTKNANVESPALTLNSNGSLTLNKYGQTPSAFTGTAAYSLSVDSNGNVIETTPSSGPLVYAARILGSFAGGVSLSQIENTTGATFSITASSAGYYDINCSNAALFNNTNAVVFVTLNSGTPGVVGAVVATLTSGVTIETLNFSGVNADLISQAMIKIEIYA